VARITRYVSAKARRKPGALKGLIRMAPDWDRAATNREIVARLEAEPLEPPVVRARAARKPRARLKFVREG
jgi:hypothetical protein